MSENSSAAPSRKKTNFFVFLPLVVVLAIFGAMAYLMLEPGRDASAIPSALIGKPAPDTVLPPIEGLVGADGNPVPGFDPKQFPDKPVLVNVWASWCAPCREEQPILMKLARENDVTIAGFNYKDKPEKALGFLDRLGNPFSIAGADRSGREAIEWGVYGVPENFIVGADGTILYKHVGPLDEETVQNEILPRLQGKKGAAGDG